MHYALLQHDYYILLILSSEALGTLQRPKSHQFPMTPGGRSISNSSSVPKLRPVFQAWSIFNTDAKICHRARHRCRDDSENSVSFLPLSPLSGLVQQSFPVPHSVQEQETAAQRQKSKRQWQRKQCEKSSDSKILPPPLFMRPSERKRQAYFCSRLWRRRVITWIFCQIIWSFRWDCWENKQGGCICFNAGISWNFFCLMQKLLVSFYVSVK